MAFTRIQAVGGSATSASHSHAETISGVTPGNLLVVIGNSAASATIADTQGNSWTRAVVSGRVSIWYTVVTTGMTTVVTVTSSQSNVIGVSIEEWSFLGTLQLGTTATGSGIGTAAATGNLTLAQTSLVVAGFDVTTIGKTYTAGTGFTLGYTVNGGGSEPFATEYNAAQSTSPIAPGITLNSSSAWTGVSAAFSEVNASQLNRTETADSLTAAAVFTAGGTLSKTEAHDTLAGLGNAIDTATFAATGGADASSAAAVFRSTAILARTEGPDTTGLVGDTPRAAALAATEAHDGLAAAGWCIIATIARTESGDVLAASGGLTATGTAGPTETHDRLTAISGTTGLGTLGPTGGDDTLAALGDAKVHGAILATAGSDTLATAASGGHVGTIGRTEAHDTLAGSAGFTASATLSVTAPGDDRLLTGSILEYHVYANGGAGAIDYDTPIATTGLLTYTTAVLACDADWRFGVRCFDPGSGLEEQNIDCAVEIILDAGCADVTNRPAAPFGLRAFAVSP